MSALANHPFVKMNGVGNDIVVVDMRHKPLPIGAGEARAAASPQGAPYDQMMALYPPEVAGTDARIRIFNNDGSFAGACGNGMRCVASLLFDETGKNAARLRDRCRHSQLLEGGDARPLHRRHGSAAFRLARDSAGRGIPRHPRDRIADRADRRSDPAFAGGVSMGNPHAVFWVDDVNAYDLTKFGPMLENHPIFPDRANITLANIKSREHIVIRTWERGAGLTKACGSAACAAAVAAARLKRTERIVRISPPGGDLTIEWRASDDHVLMTGPVTYEYEGVFNPALFSVSASA